MTATWQALEDAARLRHRFVSPQGYGLAYGSHASGTATATSDLDLVYVDAEPLPSDRTSELVDEVCQLHRAHGLGIDDEVDHNVKLYATHDDVAAATSLRCFPVDRNGVLRVDPVVVEPWFLNSEAFRLRLLLYSHTGPHLFLGGNLSRYELHRERAERALALVALALGGSGISFEQAVSVVVEHPSGAAGKDFLGYADPLHICSALRRGLAALESEGVVVDADGRFKCTQRGLQVALSGLHNGQVRSPRSSLLWHL